MFNRNNNGHNEAEETETSRWRSATMLDERQKAEPPVSAPRSVREAEADVATAQRALSEPQSLSAALERPVAAPTIPVEGEVFILVRRSPDGRIEVYECATEPEMENLIGELVSRGDDQMNMSAYQASKIDFEIHLQPRVRLMRGDS